MPCDECLNRRKFIATAAGVAGLAVISACGDGQLSGLGTIEIIPPGVPPKLMITVADFSGLSTVDVLVKVGPSQAAKRTGTNPDTFEAFSMRCSHQGCLTDIVDGQTFHCGCHQSNFANDGSVINGPFTGDTIGPLAHLAASYDPASDVLTIG